MKRQLTFRRTVQVMAVLLLATAVGASQTFIRTEKRAQTGLKYLTVISSAQYNGMAEATTALQGTASALFYNPAGIANLGSFAQVDLGTTQWIADIQHNSVAAAIHPWNGDYGTFGFFFQNVDYGEIQATIRAANDDGYLDVGTINPGGSAIGLGYAIPLTTQFSVGGTIKIAKQNLGWGFNEASFTQGSNGKDSAYSATDAKAFKTEVVAFDFGVMYATGIKSLTFGMAVRNYAREIKYIKEGFQLPLTLRIGLSMNVLDLTDLDPSTQRLLVAVDAEHPRDYSEQVRVGVEYMFMEMVALRAGYVTPADGQAFTYGLGLRQSLAGVNLGVDYSYTPFEDFDGVSRLSVRFGF